MSFGYFRYKNKFTSLAIVLKTALSTNQLFRHQNGNTLRKFFFYILSLALSASLYATDGEVIDNDTQEESSITLDQNNSETTTEEERPAPKLQNLKMSGFSRLVGYYRNMSKYYVPGVDNVNLYRGLTLPVNIGIGDGSGNPAFMLRLEGSAAKKTSFLLELGLHHNFGAWNTGVYAPGVSVRETSKVASIFSRFALQAKTVNDYGTFKVMAGGGMNWGKLSPFTLWTFQNRDDMFERYPWDPAGANWKRYGFFYSLGDIPRDLRWGNRSIQGFRIDLEDLPYGINGSFIYGRTLGIWESWIHDFPQRTMAWRVSKNFKGKDIGFNYYNQYGSQNQYKYSEADSLAIPSIAQHAGGTFVEPTTGAIYTISDPSALLENKNSQLIMTTDLKYNYKGKIRFYTEIGVGSYLDPSYAKASYYDNLNLINTSDSLDLDPAVAGNDYLYESRPANNIGFTDRHFSPIFYAEADVKKSAFGFPFKTTMFYVGRHAINNSSSILNSSIESAGNGLDLSGTGGFSNNNTFFLEGMITEIGQVTNNRAGWSFKTSKKVKNFVFDLGVGLQQELQNMGATDRDTLPSGLPLNGQRGATNEANNNGVTNSVTFYHLANQYQRSKFEYNNRFAGPYKRLLADYRRSWENVAITDTVVDYKKNFATLDFQLKHKTSVFGKELIWEAFFRGNAVTDKFAPWKMFSKEAFVRQTYEEIMGFYHIHNKWTLVLMLQSEQVKGNMRTELADANGDLMDDEDGDGVYDATLDNATTYNGKPVYDANGSPIDQIGMGYGLGFDYDFADNASLDFRWRYMTHKDKSFVRDEFRGHDVTLEFKVFF